MATSSDHLDFVCSLDICIDASSIVIGELVLFRSESYTDSFSVCSACFHSFWSCLLERVTRNQVVAFVFVSFEVFRGEIFVASAIERWAGLEPENIDPVCCVVDIPLGRGESWGESEWVLGVVGTQGGTVVAEAVVRPPGFRILILPRKQQRAGTPTRPRTLAIQRLGGVSLDDTGGGVDQFLRRTGQVAHQGVERRINPSLGPTQPQGSPECRWRHWRHWCHWLVRFVRVSPVAGSVVHT